MRLPAGSQGSVPRYSGPDGPWSVTDEGVGDPSDKGSAIVYYAVQANADCSRILSSEQNYDSFRELPKGCTILQSQKQVQIK
jgi:hypothetical protein